MRPFLPRAKAEKSNVRQRNPAGNLCFEATRISAGRELSGKQFREAIHTKGRLSAFKPGVLLDQHVKLASVCELRPPDHVLCVVHASVTSSKPFVDPPGDAAGHGLYRSAEIGKPQGCPGCAVAVRPCAIDYEQNIIRPIGHFRGNDLAMRQTDRARDMPLFCEHAGAADVRAERNLRFSCPAWLQRMSQQSVFESKQRGENESLGSAAGRLQGIAVTALGM